jgi:hypothetical protein
MPLPSSLLCSLHFSTILYSFHFPEIHFSDCCALHASTLFASLLSSLFSSVHFSDFCALHVSTLFTSLLTLLLHYSLVSSVPYFFQTSDFCALHVSTLFASLLTSLLHCSLVSSVPYFFQISLLFIQARLRINILMSGACACPLESVQLSLVAMTGPSHSVLLHSFPSAYCLPVVCRLFVLPYIYDELLFAAGVDTRQNRERPPSGVRKVQPLHFSLTPLLYFQTS